MVRKIKKIIPKLTPAGRKKLRAPVSLRTTRDELKYGKAKRVGGAGRPFLEEPRIREWKHWAIIDNDFPYSAAFKVHHMLIPKRVVNQKNLNDQERNELDKILNELTREDFYDCTLLNFPKKQSNRQHFHLHLLTYKDTRIDMGL